MLGHALTRRPRLSAALLVCARGAVVVAVVVGGFYALYALAWLLAHVAAAFPLTHA